MAKKLSLLIASIAVVAFAVPASASAAPALTDPPGTLLKVGTLFQGTTSNFLIETSLGKITCANAFFTGELTHNAGTTFRGVGKGQQFGTMCVLNGTTPVQVTDITVKELHSATVGSGTINWTITAHLPSGVTCHFESLSMPYTYASGSDSIRFTKGDFKSLPLACEPGLFTADFTIETDGEGSPIILD